MQCSSGATPALRMLPPSIPTAANPARRTEQTPAPLSSMPKQWQRRSGAIPRPMPVSYTHLTLPTTPYV